MFTSVTNGDAQPPAIFDSLPYYDNELELYPVLKEKVEREFAREGKPPQTLHPGVPPAPTLFAVRAPYPSNLDGIAQGSDAVFRLTHYCKPNLSASQITNLCHRSILPGTSCPHLLRLRTKKSGKKP